MHAREAIVSLIDRYGDELRISRRQLADEARVNPGQLSNWLRNDGPMAVDKEGRAANVMVERIDEYLSRRPGTEIERPLRLLREPLQSFGPRRRMFAAAPGAAQGEPISRDNPHYVTRMADEDLNDKLRNDVISIEITGGPKMGKSSLLLAAQQVIETTRTAILINLLDYPIEAQPADLIRAESDLFKWIARRCEEQLPGKLPVAFDSVQRMAKWISNNLLPNALNGKCVLLFDNLTSLYRRDWVAPTPHHTKGPCTHLLDALDRAILGVQVQRGMMPELRRFGIVLAYDRAHIGVVAVDGNLSARGGRLDPITLDLLAENQVASLLRTYDAAGVDDSRQAEVFAASGGHPMLTQRLCKAVFDGDFDAVRSDGTRAIAAEFVSTWSPDAWRALHALDDDKNIPPGTRSFEYLIGSGIARIDPESEMNLRPSAPKLFASVLDASPQENRGKTAG